MADSTPLERGEEHGDVQTLRLDPRGFIRTGAVSFVHQVLRE